MVVCLKVKQNQKQKKNTAKKCRKKPKQTMKLLQLKTVNADKNKKKEKVNCLAICFVVL